MAQHPGRESRARRPTLRPAGFLLCAQPRASIPASQGPGSPGSRVIVSMTREPGVSGLLAGLGFPRGQWGCPPLVVAGGHLQSSCFSQWEGDRASAQQSSDSGNELRGLWGDLSS